MRTYGVGKCCVGDYYLRALIDKEHSLGECILCGELGYCLESRKLIQLLENSILKKYSPISDFEGGIDLLSGRTYKNLRQKKISGRELLTLILNSDKKHGKKLLFLATKYMSNDWKEIIKKHWLLSAVPKHMVMEEEIYYKVKSAIASIRRRVHDLNKESEDFITRIFEQSFSSPVGLVRSIFPSDNFYLYRARLAENKECVSAILENPISQLGAPPSDRTSEGRFNSANTSLLYCSMEANTCISEIRPPVGTYVVVGKFRVEQPIRILMLDGHTMTDSKLSPFDPLYDSHVSNLEYLRCLLKYMLTPVPYNKSSDSYLISQYVSELLEYKFSSLIDGFLYDSIQFKGGKNVCMFRQFTSVSYPFKKDIQKIYNRTKNAANFIGLHSVSFELNRQKNEDHTGDSLHSGTGQSKDPIFRLCDIEVSYINGAEYRANPQYIKPSLGTVVEYSLDKKSSRTDEDGNHFDIPF